MTPYEHELIRGRSLAPDGGPAFIFGGEAHYFRIPRTLWRDRLRKMRAAFLTMIGAYIPWNVHETEEGRFDFSGGNDLGEWLSLIREEGFHLFARPGPYICSELDCGGLPGWLLGKDHLVRTDDPVYLEAAANWFREVNAIIERFLPEHGGNLVLYQIENELIWTERQYFRQLVRWVRRDGINVPLITNLAPDTRTSPDIADSLDLYPGPWNIHKPEWAVADLIAGQPGKLASCPELQMGFAVEIGSTLPTMVGPIVKEWVEVHTKTLIARGLNLLNYYIFCGGTSTGYRTGRRDISSYDFDSAVHEWGELADKYYTARRMGGALSVFGNELARTLPAADIPVDAARGVSVPVRRGERSAFIFPRNLTRSMQEIAFRLDIPGMGEVPFPRVAPLRLKPQGMKMLPANIPLGDGVTLVWTTSEVFTVTRREAETALVLAGEPGEKGEVFLRGIGGFDHIRGAGKADECDGGLLVTFTHTRGVSHIRLMVRDDEDLPAALRGFRIVLVDTATAEATWIASDGDSTLPLVSDAYFMDYCKVEGSVLRAEVSRRPGGAGFVEFPWYANPVIPPEASLGGADLGVGVDKTLRTVRIALPPVEEPGIRYTTGPWLMCPEDPRDLGGGDGWKPYTAFRGNERSGEHEGGYYVYRLKFTHDGPTDGARLLFDELHDNADVWLNGTWLAGGSAVTVSGLRLAADASSVLKKGGNELVLLLENEARPRKGDDATFTGLTGPVSLTRSEERIPLREWRRGFLAADAESVLGTVPAEASPDFDDTAWERIEVRPGLDSRLIIPPSSTIIEPGHERAYATYRTTFTLTAAQAAKGAVLDVPKSDGKCWIFVNGAPVDKKHQETFAADITPFVREGVNTLVLVIRNFRWYTTVGLHGSPSVRIVDRVLGGAWEFIRGLPGQREGRPDADPSAWEPIPDGTELPSRVWLGAEFTYDPPAGWTAPPGLVLSGWNAKVLVYLNGALIGRYHPEGPQEAFYFPDDLLGAKNRIVLFANSHGEPLRIGTAAVKPYYAVKNDTLEVRF